MCSREIRVSSLLLLRGQEIQSFNCGKTSCSLLWKLIRDVAIEGILSSNVCSRISSKAHKTSNQIKTISFPSLVNSKRCSYEGWKRIRQEQERLFQRMVNMSESAKRSSPVSTELSSGNRRRWFPWKCRKCANIFICVIYLVVLSIFNFIQNEVLLCFKSELFRAQTFSIALYQRRAEKKKKKVGSWCNIHQASAMPCALVKLHDHDAIDTER